MFGAACRKLHFSSQDACVTCCASSSSDCVIRFHFYSSSSQPLLRFDHIFKEAEEEEADVIYLELADTFELSSVVSADASVSAGGVVTDPQVALLL